ncbi:MAG: hypothetical protein ACKOCK_13160, partial [Chloroflexota bacterium]
GLIIDQHFRERDRFGRLMTLVATSPSLLGVGVAEDTCALVWPEGVMGVLGRSEERLLHPWALLPEHQRDTYQKPRNWVRD